MYRSIWTLPFSVRVDRSGSAAQVELVPALPAGTLVDVFRAALLHELRALRDACHDRVGEVAADFFRGRETNPNCKESQI